MHGRSSLCIHEYVMEDSSILVGQAQLPGGGSLEPLHPQVRQDWWTVRVTSYPVTD